MSINTLPRTSADAPEPDTRCLTCGRSPERIELHHVAGWRNDPDLVVPLCLSCHKLITAWQYAAGVNLGDQETERDPVDRARAVLVGSLLLVELFLRRHPSLTAPAVGSQVVEAHDARLVARWISRAWDQAAEDWRTNREGRWTPDARRVREEAISPAPSDRDPVATLAQWRLLLEALQTALGLTVPTTLDGIPMLDLERPTTSQVVTVARSRGSRIGDTLTVIAELHETVKATTDRALRPAPGSAPFTDAEAALVLAVAAAAMRLILATLN